MAAPSYGRTALLLLKSYIVMIWSPFSISNSNFFCQIFPRFYKFALCMCSFWLSGAIFVIYCIKGFLTMYYVLKWTWLTLWSNQCVSKYSLLCQSRIIRYWLSLKTPVPYNSNINSSMELSKLKTSHVHLNQFVWSPTFIAIVNLLA